MGEEARCEEAGPDPSPIDPFIRRKRGPVRFGIIEGIRDDIGILVESCASQARGENRLDSVRTHAQHDSGEEVVCRPVANFFPRLK